MRLAAPLFTLGMSHSALRDTRPAILNSSLSTDHSQITTHFNLMISDEGVLPSNLHVAALAPRLAM